MKDREVLQVNRIHVCAKAVIQEIDSDGNGGRQNSQGSHDILPGYRPGAGREERASSPDSERCHEPPFNLLGTADILLCHWIEPIFLLVALLRGSSVTLFPSTVPVK